MDAAARVRQRINEWLTKQGHGSKTRLAKAVPSRDDKKKGRSWLTGIRKGPARGGQDLRLADLDAVADCMGVPPGELVRRHDYLYLEVTMTEQRLLQYYRSLPTTIRNGWMAWLDHMFRPHAVDDQSGGRRTHQPASHPAAARASDRTRK